MTLSGRIIEVVTQKSYNEYLKEILKELNMDSTSMNAYSVKSLAKSYQATFWGSKNLQEPPVILIPAGGFYSNAIDIAKLMQMILRKGKIQNKIFLKESSISEMFKIQNRKVKLDNGFKIGLPFFLNNLGFGTTIQAYHGGDTIAYHSMMILMPGLPLGIMVMTNTNTGGLIAPTIALETLSFFVDAKYGIQRKVALLDIIEKEDSNFNKPEESVGVYNTSSGFFKILSYDEKGNLYCVFLNFSCELKKNKNLYEFRLILFKFLPIDIFKGSKLYFKKIDHTIMIYLVNQGSIIPYGSKVSSNVSLQKNPFYQKDSSLWEQRLGEYEVELQEELPFFFIKKLNLKKESDLLLLDIYYNQNNLPLTYVVYPIKKDLLKISGYGRNLGDTLIFKENKICYSGFCFKKNLK